MRLQDRSSGQGPEPMPPPLGGTCSPVPLPRDVPGTCGAALLPPGGVVVGGVIGLGVGTADGPAGDERT